MLHLIDKIRQETQQVCSKEYGYILSIKNIIKILDNKENIFNVLFQVEVFKPEKNQELQGNVCMIFKDGIFVDVLNIQKVLISAKTLSNYKYDKKHNVFRHITNDSIIDNMSCVNLIILDIKYNNHQFCCFGKLKE
jgi:DNA-directed RNA polymerase subunit E'/Rpb7